jgi:hypothetical protein
MAPDIIVKLENCRSFLDIYDLVGATLGAAMAAWALAPGAGMSHER